MAQKSSKRGGPVGSQLFASVGEHIAALRQEAEYNQSSLARALKKGWPDEHASVTQGYIWQLENGLIRPPLRVSKHISEVLGARLSERRVRVIVNLTRLGWRFLGEQSSVRKKSDRNDEAATAAAASFRKRQRVIQSMELRAERIRRFQNSIVPAYIQSAAYLREGLHRFWGPNPKIDSMIKARLARADILFQPGRSFEYIVREDAIRYFPLPRQLLLDQIKYIEQLVERAKPALRVRFLDIESIYKVDFFPVSQPFSIFDDYIVLADTTFDMNVEVRIDMVRRYDSLFSKLWNASLSEESSIEALKAAVQKLPDYHGKMWCPSDCSVPGD